MNKRARDFNCTNRCLLLCVFRVKGLDLRSSCVLLSRTVCALVTDVGAKAESDCIFSDLCSVVGQMPWLLCLSLVGMDYTELSVVLKGPNLW